MKYKYILVGWGLNLIGTEDNTNDYDRILVFIYDESCSVQEHETTRKDLIKRHEIEDVIIVSRPSQIIKEGVS